MPQEKGMATAIRGWERRQGSGSDRGAGRRDCRGGHGPVRHRRPAGGRVEARRPHCPAAQQDPWSCAADRPKCAGAWWSRRCTERQSAGPRTSAHRAPAPQRLGAVHRPRPALQRSRPPSRTARRQLFQLRAATPHGPPAQELVQGPTACAGRGVSPTWRVRTAPRSPSMSAAGTTTTVAVSVTCSSAARDLSRNPRLRILLRSFSDRRA